MSHVRMAALPLALATVFPSHAQMQLKETVVTATRSESRADAILSDVVVISREDIEHSSGRTLSEVISRQAGVQMAANGGLGKNSSVFIRGTESRHVLLLIDGVRAGSATTGQANFDNIPLDSIERIEVLKGPASALYGSDAVGGVIQIFTRKGATGFHPYASVTLGSEARREGTVGFHGGAGDMSYSLGLQKTREKGFSATNPAVAFGGFNADRDGFSQEGLNASLDWRFVPGWKADARVLYADSVNHFDNGPGAFDVRSELLTKLLAVGVEGQVLASWKTRLAFGRSNDNSINRMGNGPTRFNTEQDQWTWQNDIATPVGKVLAGYERLDQKVDSTTAFPVKERSVDSWFAGVNGAAGPHSWQLNARRDSNSQFGDANTGFAGYGFKFSPNWRAHASYGTSFKAPSFNALYFPNSGNPALRPERGRNAELGLSYAMGLHEFKVVRFDNRVRDLIIFQSPTFRAVNVDRARIEGWTLGYEGQAGAFSLRAALDLLDARNELNGLKLARRADQQLTAGIDYAVGAWKLGASLLAVSDRFDNTTNTTRLGGFATTDLYADYAVSKDWSVQARLNNLADKQYETAKGFNQPGRAVYVTLRYQPK
ncbi:MAG: TonB-dependent receptor domain-containing protein [Burkholderiaceae bacterium]